MKALATYVMKGRSQAALFSSLFAVLSMILPPLSYISGAIVALITMRRGIGEGGLIAVIATLALAVMSQISTGNAVVALVFAMMVWLPVWLLAVVLRQTISLPLTLAVATLLAIVVMVVFHISVGDTIMWWREVLDKVFAEALDQPGMADMSIMLENTPQFMTALMATAFFISMVASVLLARWWQAVLYNPGGFQEEFHAVRLDKNIAIIGGIVVIAAAVSAGTGSLVTDLAIIIAVYASVSGLALVHHWVTTTKANKGWLILLYLLLAFVAPQILVFLAILGFLDAWLDARRFYKSKD